MSSRRANPESGYVLLIVLIAMTLAAIAAAAAVPYVKTQIQREQEQELLATGNEYVKAIKKFYHKFGRYPATIEQLENTNHIRFLRKRYKDPLTGQDDWRIIHMGEAKYPPKLKLPGMSSQPVGQQIGQQIGTPVGGTFMGGPNAATPNQTGTANANGTTGPQPTGGVGFSLGNSGTSGSAFGGMPIIGVAVPNKAKSLIVYNEREHYNEWEFIYDPRIEAMQRAASAGAGANGGIGLPGAGGNPTAPMNTGNTGNTLGSGANTGGGFTPIGPGPH